MNCLNCDAEVTSNFCPQCGQRVKVKRLTLREGWNDFWARVYGFDGMFPRTLRDLTLRPALATREFIRGNRVKYYGPVGYFFLMITLYLLCIDFIGLDFKEIMQESQNKYNVAGMTVKGQKEIVQSVFRFVSKNLKWIAFLAVPMDALAARYLFFKKSGFNFLENTVLPFYVRGHMYWLSIAAVIIFKLTGNFALNNLVPLAGILFFGFAYSRFTDYQSKTKGFFKGMGVYLASVFFNMLLALVVIFLIILVNPEILEQIRPSNN
jgi:hypothetical protein